MPGQKKHNQKNKNQKKPVVSDAIRSRSMARLAAVQALYQMEVAGTDLNEVVAGFAAGTMGNFVSEAEGVDLIAPDTDFFRELVFGIVRVQKDLDPAINNVLAKGWALDRLDATLRAVLRAGAYELKVRTDVPKNAAITEYIDIAGAFFEDGPEPKVVNGVLDALAREWGR